MSLESAIIRLAEAIEALAASTPSIASKPVPWNGKSLTQKSIDDFNESITEGWPAGSEHGNFGKKKKCSKCGKEGVNKRTHPWHCLPEWPDV